VWRAIRTGLARNSSLTLFRFAAQSLRRLEWDL
jgi:hypothetical protein